MVLDRHSNENEIKIKELEKKYSELLTNMEKLAKEKDEKHFKNMTKKGNQDAKKIVSRAKVVYQNEVLIGKTRMIDSFKDHLLEEIEGFIESGNYEAYFTKSLEEGMKNFSKEDKLKIIVREEDKKYLEDINAAIQVSDELLGGFHVIANEKIKYDYSIEGKLLESSEFIGCLIQKLIINKAGESNECK
jgi:vacuolar-type H+-ATPase subunit E/Vma4